MWRDSETEVDYLNFDYLTELLTELIDNKKLLPATIGVYGDWGSGKSSLIKMAIKNLTEKRSSEKIDVLNFNGWMFEGYEDAKSVLLESILDTISAREGLSKKATEILKGLYRSVDKIKLFKKGAAITTDVLATGGIGTVIGETVKQLATLSNQEISESQLEKVTTHVRDELNHNELRKDLKKFQAECAELLLESKIEKLVVFIDELDRCKPSFTVRLLEQIKHYMHDERITYVLSINTEELQHTIKNYYGDSFDACRYLDRFFYLRINLPPVDKKKFYMNIELNGRYYLEIISRRIIDVYNMQLREITRFYRQVRTAAYVPTHDDEKWNCIFPDGEARQFMLSCIVPIIIGLKMVDISMYEQFISGKSGKPMVDILNTKEFSTGLLCRFLKEDESFSQIEKKKLITPEEKILEIYNAIFVNKYSGNDYQKTIGKCEFDADSRKFVLVAASMLSQYANYEI